MENGLLRWQSGKESGCQCRRCKRHGFDPWVGKILWRRQWWPVSEFLPGKFHRQRILVGCSPQGCRIEHDWAPEHLQHTEMNNKSVAVDGYGRGENEVGRYGFKRETWWTPMMDMLSTMLHQVQFLGSDVMLWFWYYLWEKLDKRQIVSLYYFLQLCVNLQLFCEKFI